jgi:AcrR family transcriptional regulator
MKADRSYHHGDLRKALLETALKILDREGFQALTLRKIAAEANVSHAAPAHYFPTLEDLLTALAAIGFQRLDAALEAVDAKHQRSVAAHIDEFVAAYLRFAQSETGLFRLMFAAHRINWLNDELKSSSKRAYERLETIAARIADARGEGGAANHIALEQLIWSAAHGYANLALGGQVPKPGQKQPALPPKLSKYLLP